MNEYTRKLLDKAIDTIESAELLLDHENAVGLGIDFDLRGFGSWPQNLNTVHFGLVSQAKVQHGAALGEISPTGMSLAILNEVA